MARVSDFFSTQSKSEKNGEGKGFFLGGGGGQARVRR